MAWVWINSTPHKSLVAFGEKLPALAGAAPMWDILIKQRQNYAQV